MKIPLLKNAFKFLYMGHSRVEICAVVLVTVFKAKQSKTPNSTSPHLNYEK